MAGDEHAPHDTAALEALRRAAAAFQAGHLADAETLSASAWAALPGNPDAGNLYAAILAQRDHLGAAIDVLRVLADRQPNDPRSRFNLGYLLQRAGDLEAARREYEAAGAAEPRYVPAWINLGNLNLILDAPAAAKAAFRQALSIEPRHPGAWEGLGVARLALKRPADAEDAFRQAIDCEAQRASLHANLGVAFHARGEAQQALENYRRASVLEPDNGEFHAYIAQAFYDLGDHQAAVAATDDCLNLRHYHARALAVRALALAESGRTAEAWPLIDIDRLLIRRRVEPPAGTASLEAFHAMLIDAVRHHPSLVEERPGKTTRNGAQTGELFDGSAPVLDQLRAIILDTIRSHGAEAGDPDHPFWRGRPQRWQLRNWANLLRRDGYKEPHNHPSGWLSGVYYVKVPKVTATDDSARPGWIEFGRPDPRYAYSVEPPISYIRPEEGLMILFPSYIWHRTMPFHSDDERISIAFDVVPGR